MKKLKIDYLLITHRIYQNGQPKLGGLDRTKEFLIQKEKAVLLIENPITIFGRHLVLNYRSFIKLLTKNDEKIIKEFKIFIKKAPFIWIAEIFYNCFYISKYCQKSFICICADPLSVLSGYLLKKMGFVEKLIFHVTDYADKRFNNEIFNWFYMQISKFCLKKADIVLAVSGRMIDRFKQINPQGNYFYFPNSPDFISVPKKTMEDRDKETLIITGLSIEGMEYENILLAVKSLKPVFPNLTFKVIGSGGAEEKIAGLIKKYNLDDSVILYGFLPRQKALEIMASSTIGIIIYKEPENFHYYRDSLKMREYAACGLPIITDKTTFTSEEAEEFNACLRVDNTSKDIANAIKLLLSNKDIYEKYSDGAIKWAKAFDKKILLEKLLTL